MTDVSHSTAARYVGKEYAVRKPQFNILETYWGYVVRPKGGPRLIIQIQQLLATLVGASFLAAAFGMLLVPQMAVGTLDFTMRAGAAVIFCGIAAFCLWYATRGTVSELQIDNNLGEVREVIRNRAGTSTLLGSYGFDAIGGVYIERREGNNSELVLRYRNTSQKLPVARGHASTLEHLRDRLGQDLMLGHMSAIANQSTAPAAMVAAE